MYINVTVEKKCRSVFSILKKNDKKKAKREYKLYNTILAPTPPPRQFDNYQIEHKLPIKIACLLSQDNLIFKRLLLLYGR